MSFSSLEHRLQCKQFEVSLNEKEHSLAQKVSWIRFHSILNARLSLSLSVCVER